MSVIACNLIKNTYFNMVTFFKNITFVALPMRDLGFPQEERVSMSKEQEL